MSFSIKKVDIIQNILNNNNFKNFLNIITIKDIDNLYCFIYNKMIYNIIELIDKIIDNKNIDLNNIVISIIRYNKLCEEHHLIFKNILLESKKMICYDYFKGGNGTDDYINKILSMEITQENINLINSNLKIGASKRIEYENSYFIVNIDLLNPYINKYRNIINKFKIMKKGNIYIIPIKNIIDTKFIIRNKNNYYLNLFYFQERLIPLKEKIIPMNLGQINNDMNIIIPINIIRYLFTIANNNNNEFNKILNVLNIKIYENGNKKTFAISKNNLDKFGIKIINGKFIFPPNFRQNIIVQSHINYIIIPKSFIKYLYYNNFPIEKLGIINVNKEIYVLPYNNFIYLDLKVDNKGNIVYSSDIINKLTTLLENKTEPKKTKYLIPESIKPESLAQLETKKNDVLIEEFKKEPISSQQLVTKKQVEPISSQTIKTEKQIEPESLTQLETKKQIEPISSQHLEIEKSEPKIHESLQQNNVLIEKNKPTENLYSIIEELLNAKELNKQLNEENKSALINEDDNKNVQNAKLIDSVGSGKSSEKEDGKIKSKSKLVRTLVVNNKL